MSKRYWIGIDVSKKTFHAAVADVQTPRQAWTQLRWERFESTRAGMKGLRQWLAQQRVEVEAIAGVCLEATGRLGQKWARMMNGGLGPVSMVNPARPVGFARSLGLRDKTDRIDACVLALFGKAHQPEPTVAEDPCYVELREIFRLHRALQKQCLANKQRLNDGPQSALVRKELRATIRQQEKRLTKLEQAMNDLIRTHPELRRQEALAQTVTGIGPKSALALLAELGDLRHYTRKEIVALTGLYPRRFQSGTSVERRPRLAKGGRAAIRGALYMAAMSAQQHDPQMHAFALRLEKNEKEPMQILAAIMRKLLLLARAVIVSGIPYDPAYRSR
jgi:transposase